MTPGEQAVAFLQAVRTGPLTLPEIAERIGVPLTAAREILFRGVQAKRLRVNDKDRQRIVIEERKRGDEA